MNVKKYGYFLLSIGLLILDQVSKIWVVKNIEVNHIGWTWGGDFFRLIHVRNLGVAFSIGHELPGIVRMIVLIIMPIFLLGFLAYYLIQSKNIQGSQRWFLAALLGGGLGNQLDRVFRPEGVVDFLDFKFYGLFGLERWPTFNVADSTMLVSALCLCVLVVIQEVKERRDRRE